MKRKLQPPGRAPGPEAAGRGRGAGDAEWGRGPEGREAEVGLAIAAGFRGGGGFRSSGLSVRTAGVSLSLFQLQGWVRVTRTPYGG